MVKRHSLDVNHKTNLKELTSIPALPLFKPMAFWSFQREYKLINAIKFA